MTIRSNELFKFHLISFDFDMDQLLTERDEVLQKQISPALNKVLKSPISFAGDIYTFSHCQEIYGELSGAIVEDRTGAEADFNKMNMIDYVAGRYHDRAGDLLRNGLCFSVLLCRKLQKEYPQTSFKVLFSFGISKYVDSVVRFYANRLTDTEWIADDFERQIAVQGIATFDT